MFYDLFAFFFAQKHTTPVALPFHLSLSPFLFPSVHRCVHKHTHKHFLKIHLRLSAQWYCIVSVYFSRCFRKTRTLSSKGRQHPLESGCWHWRHASTHARDHRPRSQPSLVPTVFLSFSCQVVSTLRQLVAFPQFPRLRDLDFFKRSGQFLGWLFYSLMLADVSPSVDSGYEFLAGKSQKWCSVLLSA